MVKLSFSYQKNIHWCWYLRVIFEKLRVGKREMGHKMWKIKYPEVICKRRRNAHYMQVSPKTNFQTPTKYTLRRLKCG